LERAEGELAEALGRFGSHALALGESAAVVLELVQPTLDLQEIDTQARALLAQDHEALEYLAAGIRISIRRSRSRNVAIVGTFRGGGVWFGVGRRGR